jgi:ubiquitin-protein ligase
LIINKTSILLNILIRIEMDIIQSLVDILDNNIKLTQITDGKILMNINSYQLLIVLCHDNRIKLEGEQDSNSQHMINVLYRKFGKNLIFDSLFDIMTFLKNTNNLNNYCYICSEESCNKPDCIKSKYSLVTDNTVMDAYNRDPTVFDFLMKTTIYGANGAKRDKVFTPFPPIFKDFNELDLVIKKLDLNQLYATIKMSYKDSELYEKLGSQVYGFIKYVILSNNFRLKTDKLDVVKFVDLEVVLGKDMVVFEVIHDIIKIKDFDRINPNYLYHGSGISNWYSIMRNGLKNYSGTTLMANGQAYGAGIYLSDDPGMSLGYSFRESTNNLYIVGVVQVVKSIDQYKKTQGIYVVENDKELIVRYLIVGSSFKNLVEIKKYFETRCLEITTSITEMVPIIIKRITKEIQELKDKRFDVITENLDFDDIGNIVVSIKIKELTFNIIFDRNYPHYPPIIMLHKPIIKVINSNYLQSNGAVIMKELAPRYWNPKTKIASLVKLIKKEKPEYEIINKDKNYDYNEVLIEYNNKLNSYNYY